MKYVRNLKPDRKIYEDIVETSRLDFRFREKIDNSKYVSKLAENMHYYPIENVINFEDVFDEFDEKRIASVLAQLNPTRLLLTLSSALPLKGSKQEQYFKAQYKVEGLPPITKEPFPKMAVKQNPFLPINPALHTATEQFPHKIAPNIMLDNSKNFGICKGSVTIYVYSDLDKLYQELYYGWLHSMMKLKTYDAINLGIEIDYNFSNILVLSYYGYSDTVLKLVQFLADDIQSLFAHKEKAECMFSMLHEALLQACRNFFLGSSDEVVMELQKRLFDGKDNTSIEQDLKVLEAMTYKSFHKFAKDLWANSRVEWIFVGNF
jgi:secreted Zn-dependent insulinase-like peptidase